ncbi:hypothetical protein Mapa_012069 [Marchantia paleacea]|nr:hypothetical protein Mapa_012069 [Marchantia paleacea]
MNVLFGFRTDRNSFRSLSSGFCHQCRTATPSLSAFIPRRCGSAIRHRLPFRWFRVGCSQVEEP